MFFCSIGILTLMVKAGLAASNGEARRLVVQGGVLVDGAKVEMCISDRSWQAYWSVQPSASCIRWLEAFFCTQECTAATENLQLKDV